MEEQPIFAVCNSVILWTRLATTAPIVKIYFPVKLPILPPCRSDILCELGRGHIIPAIRPTPSIPGCDNYHVTALGQPGHRNRMVIHWNGSGKMKPGS